MGGSIGEFIAGLENLSLIERISERFAVDKTTAFRRVAIAVLLLALALIAFFVWGQETETTETIVIEEDSSAPEQTSARFDEALVAGLDDVNIQEATQPVVVYVTGAVSNPGVMTLESGQRISDAIASAGGLLPDAAQAVVNFALPLTDGMHVHIPSTSEVSADVPQDGLVSGEGSIAPSGEATATSSEYININTADLAALQTLNGIGPATAQKIIDYRTANGRFQTKEDLLKVSGIGEKKFAAIEARITV